MPPLLWESIITRITHMLISNHDAEARMNCSPDTDKKEALGFVGETELPVSLGLGLETELPVKQPRPHIVPSMKCLIDPLALDIPSKT